ncbi:MULTISPECIES: methyltransferase domain-containing protein [unclassified Actinomadura]|uniref:SAM-dependent methyltransferase n=1 Tax=unclassified Actinomadura TaxID=2626254 RepID=UPI0011EF80C6|nr:methyltransferase domain-containing protein [Actinomadura sp. K4S16]
MASGETTSTAFPSPGEIGHFYDRTGRHLTRFFGGAMHYGYWTGPDDDSSLEEASERFTDLMAEKLGVAGGRILDLGCGTGEPAIRVARTTGAEVIGISVSAEDVRTATARAAAAGLAERVRFEVADAMAPPFPTDSFDAVLALESMGHMPDRARVLAEIARVLRPGGRLAFCEAFRKATLSPEAERAARAVFDAWMGGSPLIPIEDYPPLVRGAGLELDEVVDVSVNIQKTQAHLMERMRAGLDEDPEFPPDLARVMQAQRDVLPFRDEIVAQGGYGGYLVVTAHLPA